ncbi:MAG: acyltransferase [Lachnospiraceae bacterium]|nr:acyltransferase [Lachnospiraceae bacterium]
MKNVRFITLESVVATFAVVVLHTNGVFWNFSTEHYWFTANIIECLFYFSVPIFFMITGATLLDYDDRYSTKVFFIKRLKKTFIPFIAWSLIGVVYLIVMNRIGLNEITFKYLFYGITKTTIVNLYWFFPPLFCVYLSIPLIAAVKKEKKQSIYLYTSIICFICNICIPFVINVFKIDYKFSISVSVGSGYLLYVLIGYLLSYNDLELKQRIIVYFLGLFGLLVHIMGTYKLSIEAGTIIRTFKGYNNVPCIMYSIGIFVLIKIIAEKISSEHFWKIINFLGKYTFSVYLMQWFIMDFVTHKFSEINIYSMWYRLGTPILIYLICVIITIVLRKIPILKKIVP